MQKRAALMIKTASLYALLLFTAAAACSPSGDLDEHLAEARDPLLAMETAMETEMQPAMSVSTTTTATAAADECVLSGGRRVSRTLYQIGACAWAAGVIASGHGAITACCPAEGDAMTSTASSTVSQNCQSARTWVQRSHEYWGARCWRRMSCGEINGLLLWFSTKKTLFANLQRWCGEDGVEEIPDYVYEDATELGD